jgi:adenylate cyclase
LIDAVTGTRQKLPDLGRGWGAGLSRGVAAAVLALFVVLQLGEPALFDLPRQTVFDGYQRSMPRVRPTGAPPVVVVAIDNLAVNAEGEWPWPHDRLARLMRSILAAGPAVLGLDLALPRTPSGSDSRRGADDALAAAIASGPVVVGVVGDGRGDCAASRGGGDPGPFAAFIVGGRRGHVSGPPCFASVMRSGPTIDGVAAGHGLLFSAPDPDGVSRRLGAVASVQGHLAPGFALEAYRIATHATGFRLYRDRRQLRAVGVGSLRLPTDGAGAMRIYFTPPSDIGRCSAEGLLRQGQCFDAHDGHRIDLRGRRVLIGLDAEGVGDQARMTPMGVMPEVAIDAQGLDNLFSGELVRRPSGASGLEAILTAVLGLFLIIVLPATRIGWRSAAVAAAPLALLAAGGAALWWRFNWLTDVATPAIGCMAVFIGLLVGGLAEIDSHRRRLRRELDEGRLSAARAEGELEAGRRIQMGILPTPESLAVDPRFDLHAVMTPARQIGGDLYDFFLIDPDRLFFAIGDVSGKGLPASLFMALGKSLCKSCALRGDGDIGSIIRLANAEISRDNPEMEFITLFAAILNLETGELDLCNAGHDAPFLLTVGQPPRDIPASGGPPLCVVEGFPYRTESRRLARGDLLCITTDGVTEAMTPTGDLLGRPAVERELGAMPEGLGARGVTEALQAAVVRFVAGAEPSDDLAILTIRWNGPPKMSQNLAAVDDLAAGYDRFATDETADRAEVSRP